MSETPHLFGDCFIGCPCWTGISRPPTPQGVGFPGDFWMKPFLINLVKLSIALALIGYLIVSKQLDFGKVQVIFNNPMLMLGLCAYWLVGPTILGSIRWRYLLLGCGYDLPLLKTIRLQMTGFFFNTAMPGAVGGDLVKVLYIIKEQPGHGKTPALMSIFLDRLLGLSGLFLVGLSTAIYNYKLIVGNPILVSIVLSLLAVCLISCLFFIAALYRYKGDDPFLKLLSNDIIGFSHIRKIYECVRAYKDKRDIIIKSLLISMFIQLSALSIFYLVTLEFIPHLDPSFGIIAAVFPIGLLTIALPIAPGGLGIGHVAFNRLFEFIGYEQGANIFNVFILSQLFLNLLGAIPYLSLKQGQPTSNLDSCAES